MVALLERREFDPTHDRTDVILRADDRARLFLAFGGGSLEGGLTRVGCATGRQASWTWATSPQARERRDGDLPHYAPEAGDRGTLVRSAIHRAQVRFPPPSALPPPSSPQAPCTSDHSYIQGSHGLTTTIDYKGKGASASSPSHLSDPS